MKVRQLITSFIYLSACFSYTAKAEEARPNILWLFSDDHAYQALGVYGGRFEPFNLTPNLDSIANQGMRFEKCYVGNSICGPSRATLLTGKHSHLHGKVRNKGTEFDHNQPQFQKLLQKSGYQTAMIGKIHLDGKMQGFDYWEVLPGQGSYSKPSFLTAEGETQYEGHSTDVITDRALNWLNQTRDKSKPFMAMVHYKAPHRNWLPHERFREKFKNTVFPEPETLFDTYETRGTAAHKQSLNIEKSMTVKKDLKGNKWPERKNLMSEELKGKELVQAKYQAYMRDYLACIAGVDENVGRLLDYLRENDLEKNTIVMYSSDQGFYLGEHGWFDKRFMYEQSFRTPLIAKWPGKIKPKSVNHDLVQNIDFAETFLDLAGVEIPADMQGESLVPVMLGKTPENWRDSLYYHYYEYPGVHSVRRHEGVTTGDYKLIRFYGKGVKDGEEWEMYDLKRDKNELQNEYNNPEYAERVESLKKELSALREEYKVIEVEQD